MTEDGPGLEPWQRELLDEARRGTLGTIGAHGRPRLVPVCYATDADASRLWIAIDQKAKRGADPKDLARVQDIARDGRVTLLVDRWSEDWAELAWVRLEGSADLIGPREPDHRPALEALRARYPQYVKQWLEDRPVIRVRVERANGWRPPPPAVTAPRGSGSGPRRPR